MYIKYIMYACRYKGMHKKMSQEHSIRGGAFIDKMLRDRPGTGKEKEDALVRLKVRM